MDNLNVIMTVVGSTLTILIFMLTMFLWVRTEANSDRKHITDIQREDRKDLLQIGKNLEKTVSALEKTVSAIEMEMKDFHGRLIKIETNRK